MPEPVRLPLEETEMAAAFENPFAFVTVPSVAGVVLTGDPVNAKPFRKSPGSQTYTMGPKFGLFQ